MIFLLLLLYLLRLRDNTLNYTYLRTIHFLSVSPFLAEELIFPLVLPGTELLFLKYSSTSGGIDFKFLTGRSRFFLRPVGEFPWQSLKFRFPLMLNFYHL